MFSMYVTQRIVGGVARVMAYPRHDIPNPWVDRVWTDVLPLQDEC